MKKEKFKLVFLIVFIIVLLIQITTAQTQTKPAEFLRDFFKETMNAVIEISSPILISLMGVSETDEFLFQKVLILFLLFAVVYISLNRSDIFEGRRSITFVISAIVSILAIRFIVKENDFFLGILLPYGALGAAITIFLPLVAYGLFVYTSVPGTFARRAAWIVYGIIFLILWYTRFTEISETANSIYWIASILIALFVVFDPAVRTFFGMAQQAKFLQRIEDARIAELEAKIYELREVDTPAARRTKSYLIRQLRRLGVSNP